VVLTSSHVPTSGSPVADPKSGPDYSVFITKIFYLNFTYPTRCFRLPLIRLRVPLVDDHVRLYGVEWQDDVELRRIGNDYDYVSIACIRSLPHSLFTEELCYSVLCSQISWQRLYINYNKKM
jgi:hypothetical protein